MQKIVLVDDWSGEFKIAVVGAIPGLYSLGRLRKLADHEPENKAVSSHHPWFLCPVSCFEFLPNILIKGGDQS